MRDFISKIIQITSLSIIIAVIEFSMLNEYYKEERNKMYEKVTTISENMQKSKLANGWFNRENSLEEFADTHNRAKYAGVFIGDDGYCDIYDGEGKSFIGIYDINGTTLTCRTVIKKTEDDGLKYEEDKLKLTFRIVNEYSIKLVLISNKNLVQGEGLVEGKTYYFAKTRY